MRRFPTFLCTVFCLCALFTIYFFLGGTLVGDAAIMSAPASEYPEAFSVIDRMVQQGACPQATGTEALGDSSAYTLIDCSLDLSNWGIFDAQWLEIELIGAPGDTAVYSITGYGDDIGRFSTGNVNLKIITTTPDSPRSIRIGYYILSMHRHITIDL